MNLIQIQMKQKETLKHRIKKNLCACRNLREEDNLATDKATFRACRCKNLILNPYSLDITEMSERANLLFLSPPCICGLNLILTQMGSEITTLALIHTFGYFSGSWCGGRSNFGLRVSYSDMT